MGNRQDDGRGRNWATILYLESASPSFKDTLHGWHVKGFLSPLHDKDTWTVDDEKQNSEHKAGTVKKAHYHLMLMFDGNKSHQQMKKLFDQIGGVGCERVSNANSYARYLIHLDDPDKVTYSAEDIISFGGLSYDITAQSQLTKHVNLKDVLNIIRTHEIIFFSDLVDAVILTGDYGMLDIITKNTYFINEYIKSNNKRKAYTEESVVERK